MPETIAPVVPFSPTVLFQRIRKRNGQLAAFDATKITAAIS